MKIKKFEKITYVGCPWFFGMVLIATGIFASFKDPDSLVMLFSTCAGLICMSMFCICALLVKIVEK